MKTKRIQCLVWLCLLAVSSNGFGGEPVDMRLWFTQAAESRSEALALGNGRVGAVLFHGVEKERFNISEETLWSNGPVSVEEGCRMRPHISKVWKLLDEGRFKEANDLVEEHWFDDRPQLRVDLMANMTLTFEGQKDFTGYRRELDMRTAMARLEYTGNGARYTRESFISAVDDVMVIRLTCDQPGRISFLLALDREVDDREYTVSADEDTLTMRGPGGRPEAGLRFELQVKTVAEGGEVSTDGKVLRVTGADSVLIYLNAETNFEYGRIMDVDLTELCRKKIEAAA
ncbi:MAG: glycoside hydrolase family 95 protein [Kiritimatiellales bacterium]|nr:glycoside hydrolase family 95 protein [Kiritimatiellales bacterium]